MSTPEFPEFPDGFFFGAATASYQIEGAYDEGGRGPSIWDTYCREPGRVEGGATGDIACDHYHRYREDVALLHGLGVDSYRFSVAWPRIQPDGTGPANAAGLDFWITLNEPYCSAFVGYATGAHAPGAQEGRGALAAAHHLLVGHGLAVSALREAGAQEVGITLNPDRLLPATPGSPADLAAVRRAETLHNEVWLDPLFAGRYPQHEAETWGEPAGGSHRLDRSYRLDTSYRLDGDLELIAAPLDFVGINYYRPITIADAPHRDPDPATRTAVDIRATETWRDDVRHTTMGWPVAPHTFTDLLIDLTKRYPELPPLVITENGSAEADTVTDDGRVHDTERIDYLRSHLEALSAAIRAGIDVRGYYVWSLLDNFEWARGYGQRFGIVRVDYDTQERTPKDSYRWFRDLIATHRTRTDTADKDHR
ncbi:family 1 glycosylhydrolase [Streptomyces sp. NPDC055006]